MSFGENLKYLMTKNKITAKQIAELLGVSRGLVTHWSNNIRTPNPTQIKIMANFLGVSSDFLLGNTNEENIVKHFVPLIGRASCGIPQEYDLNGYEPFPIDAKLFKKGMYAVEAEGDSMSPKINDGDIVYCCPENICNIENNSIVHYRLNGESGIKKYKINEAGSVISLIPLNTNYDIITVTWDDNPELKLSKVVGSVDTNY